MNNHVYDHITNEYIRELPLLAFDGDIEVVEDEESFGKAMEALYHADFLGFDTEKKPTFRKGDYHPTAMIQLASCNKAFLFRLNKIGYPKPLFDIMSDPNRIKLGISIGDDIKGLRKLSRFQPAAFSDLNDIAHEMGIYHVGVKKLAAIFLDRRISKGQQTSNWENEKLTKAQQRYAATDAWLCLEIHKKLKILGYV